jgi:hypothetical protein
MTAMKPFLPPPVTPSERNRSPRVACMICERRPEPGRPRVNKNGKLFTAARDAVGEEPIGMGGW